MERGGTSLSISRELTTPGGKNVKGWGAGVSGYFLQGPYLRASPRKTSLASSLNLAGGKGTAPLSTMGTHSSSPTCSSCFHVGQCLGFSGRQQHLSF